MRAASQLSRRGPTDVDVALYLHVNQKSDYDMMIYEVSSKYSNVYSSYRSDKKFYQDADANANGIRPKNMSLHPSGSAGHNYPACKQLIVSK